MTNHRNNRLDNRVTRLEDRLVPAPQREVQSWIWWKGRLYSQSTDEVFDSEEERSQAYAGWDILFIDRVIVYAEDGRPCGYSDQRYFDTPELEEAAECPRITSEPQGV